MLLRRQLKSPVAFLATANIVGALVGAFSTILTARWLGAEAYGVIGVLWGFNATALNFVDLRLADLMVKLFYQPPPDGTDPSAYRASLLQLCVLGYLALAVIFSILSLASIFAFVRYFTTQTIQPWWVLASVVTIALNYLINPMSQMHRLQGRFKLLGTLAIGNAILSSSLLLIAMTYARNLDGYYGGSLAGGLATACIFLGCSVAGWMRHDRLPILRRHGWQTLRRFWREAKFLFWGNILGYVKMGHRASDVLLVGFLGDDRLTGIYKLARSLTDKLNLLYDATNQVHQPSLMRLLHLKAESEFRSQARRLLSFALLLTTCILATEWLWYPAFHEVVLAGRFPGSQASVMLLTIPFFFTLGVYLWVWPMIIHHQLAGVFSSFSVLAVIGQYGISYLTFRATGLPSAFALGYLAYYLILLLPTVLLLRRHWPHSIPFTHSDRAHATS